MSWGNGSVDKAFAVQLWVPLGQMLRPHIKKGGAAIGLYNPRTLWGPDFQLPLIHGIEL